MKNGHNKTKNLKLNGERLDLKLTNTLDEITKGLFYNEDKAIEELDNLAIIERELGVKF